MYLQTDGAKGWRLIQHSSPRPPFYGGENGGGRHANNRGAARQSHALGSGKRERRFRYVARVAAMSEPASFTVICVETYSAPSERKI